MLKNLRISTKLYTVLILLVAVTLVLAVISWSMLNQVTSASDEAAEAQRQAQNLSDMEVAHLDWALELSQSLNTQEPFTGELDHTRCALGRWYFEFLESDEFRALPPEMANAYRELEEPHRNLHDAAAELVNQLETGNYSVSAWTEAETMYEDEVLHYLGETRTVLHRLEQLLAERVEELETEMAETVGMSQVSTASAAGAGLLIAVFFGGFTVMGICRSLGRTVDLVANMSEGEGDLTQRLPVNGTDELAMLSQHLNKFIERLQLMVQDVAQSAEQTAEKSNEVSAAVQETSASIEEVASTSNEFASTIQASSDNSQKMESLATDTLEKTNQGAEQIEQTVQAMQEINANVSKLSGEINGLDSQSEQIRSIVDIITGIADQTNLLALNAAIEAARAGEHGRGFAVVAEEVRKLAEQSGKAAGEITEVIGEMRSVVQDTVQQSQQSSDKVTEGTEAVQVSGRMFADIRSTVDELTEGIRSIANSSEELASGSEEIAASSEEQSASIEQIGAAIETVANTANELQALVKQFKV